MSVNLDKVPLEGLVVEVSYGTIVMSIPGPNSRISGSGKSLESAARTLLKRRDTPRKRKNKE